MRIFNLVWGGWSDQDGLPALPGIYAAWVASIRLRAGDYEPVVFPAEVLLVYLGQSGDMRARIPNHEKWPCWLSERASDRQAIIFTYAPMTGEREGWRLAVENCLIAHHRPPCNTDDLTYRYDLGVHILNGGRTFGKLVSPCVCRGSSDPDNY